MVAIVTSSWMNSSHKQFSHFPFLPSLLSLSSLPSFPSLSLSLSLPFPLSSPFFPSLFSLLSLSLLAPLPPLPLSGWWYSIVCILLSLSSPPACSMMEHYRMPSPLRRGECQVGYDIANVIGNLMSLHVARFLRPSKKDT